MEPLSLRPPSMRQRLLTVRDQHPLSDFCEALAAFNARPTVAAFREVQLAGRRVDDARRATEATDHGTSGARLPTSSTEGSVR
jgi:hypothetical protein